MTILHCVDYEIDGDIAYLTLKNGKVIPANLSVLPDENIVFSCDLSPVNRQYRTTDDDLAYRQLLANGAK